MSNGEAELQLVGDVVTGGCGSTTLALGKVDATLDVLAPEAALGFEPVMGAHRTRRFLLLPPPPRARSSM